MVTGWAPEGADLSVGEVVGTVVVSVAVGAALLALLERRSARAWATWVALAVAVAVLSALPLLHLEVDAHSKVALVAMHLTTGAAAIAGHAFVRLRASARGGVTRISWVRFAGGEPDLARQTTGSTTPPATDHPCGRTAPSTDRSIRSSQEPTS